MSVTLSEVKRAAKAHRAPLAGESAGYLVLAIADQVLSAPRLVETSDIQLTEDGGLRVLSGRASSDTDAELGLRRALDALLLVASSGSAALTRASRRTSPMGLSALVRELEAALIPVNRAAARRALARLHRETARALSSGSLPEEEPEARDVAPPAVAQKTAVLAPALVSAPAPLAEPEPEPDLETRAIRLAPEPVPVLSALPALSPELDAMLTALCVEPAELEPLEESDALTVALDVRMLSEVEPALEFDVDVDFDALESESGVAPTVVRDAPVAPIAALALDEPSTDLPVEACTRPEPVVLRKSRRPESDGTEFLPRTPTLGSLAAQLPVLEAAQIAELSALRIADEASAQVEPDEVSSSVESEVTSSVESEVPPSVRAELVVCSAPMEECTEPMPEVASLLPGVAIVASRKSDVTELLKSFQVADDDSNQGLCRAIKEMAGLDLTPAPFAALIR
jgi:hypothetical protein